MWPFSRKHGAEEQRAFEAWPWSTGGPAGGPADRTLSAERALSLVPVFGAARLLADSVSSLEPMVFTKGTGNGGIPKRMPTPSLFVQPSVHGTIVDWLHRLVISMALQGDGIGYVTARDYYGFPTMVEWLNPQQVMTDDGTVLSGVGSYMNPIWLWNGRRMDPSDIVHIPWFSLPYKVRGLSPIGAYRTTANVGLGAQEYAANWFQNGGVPPGTFRNSQQKVSKDDADLITTRLTNRLQTRRPLVFGNDWEYTPIAIKPNEAQFIETARLTATEIATIYGVPPEKIGGTQGSSFTYTNVEQATIDFLTFSLRPWLKKIEMALSNLFPRGTFVKFDTTDLLRTDAKTRAEIDQISLGGPGTPYREPDEVRADHDWPPMPKPDPAMMPTPQPNPTPLPPSPPNGAQPPAPTNGAKPLAVGRT